MVFFYFMQILWKKRRSLSESVYNVTVDGIDFHCKDNHTLFDAALYSHKLNRAGFRYEIAISIDDGHIVSIVGPFKAGAYSDLKIFRTYTKNILTPGEKVLADRGYRGDERVVTNFDVGIDATVKKARGRLLARHETINGRLKMWNCLNVAKFRHDAEKHSNFVNAVAVMVQLRISAQGGVWS